MEANEFVYLINFSAQKVFVLQRAVLSAYKKCEDLIDFKYYIAFEYDLSQNVGVKILDNKKIIIDYLQEVALENKEYLWDVTLDIKSYTWSDYLINFISNYEPPICVA